MGIFKRNTLLLGFLLIILLGMLAYLFAWNISNIRMHGMTFRRPPMSHQGELPRGKIIMHVGDNVLDNQKEVTRLLLDQPGVERVYIISGQRQMVIFYNTSEICMEGVITPLTEKEYEIYPVVFDSEEHPEN